VLTLALAVGLGLRDIVSRSLDRTAGRKNRSRDSAPQPGSPRRRRQHEACVHILGGILDRIPLNSTTTAGRPIHRVFALSGIFARRREPL